MKIAVVGSGISGLSAAWLLSKRHEVTLYEKDARLGGHSNTVDVPAMGGSSASTGMTAVDTGFIVFNPKNYPNLIALFDHLGVETAPSD
ncbi:MAG: FAD-dependent oxidoreductase, partial [Hyphomicrobium sp.]